MPKMNDELSKLLETVQKLSGDAQAPPDAIDRILTSPRRETQVRSLYDDPVVQRFRDDLTNGFIRVDTANALFQLLGNTLNRVVSI